VILNASELGEDDANVFGALGDLLAGERFDRERVGPVVRERTEVIEPVGIGHGSQVAGALRNLLVIAVKVSEDRLEANDAFPIEGHIHSKDAVSGGMVRPHGNFKQLGITIRRNNWRTIPAFELFRIGGEKGHCQWAVPSWLGLSSVALCSAARASTAS
jgi:hypothetical protein